MHHNVIQLYQCLALASALISIVVKYLHDGKLSSAPRQEFCRS